jgi:hypothetical protein
MKKTIQEEFGDQKVFQRHPPLPTSVPTDADTDDYEDFGDDESEMMQTLWHKGEEAYEDELMGAEDY